VAAWGRRLGPGGFVSDVSGPGRHLAGQVADLVEPLADLVADLVELLE
jgi:hypothetical protein